MQAKLLWTFLCCLLECTWACFSRMCLEVGHGTMCVSNFKDNAAPLPAPQWWWWFALSCKTPHCFTSSPTLTTLRRLYFGHSSRWTSLATQLVKNLPAVQETWVQSLDLEEPLEKEMATHSIILAWEVLWTEEPDGLQSTSWTRLRTKLAPPSIDEHNSL